VHLRHTVRSIVPGVGSASVLRHLSVQWISHGISCRLTWEIIKRHRHDRAIVLTTHSMEEVRALCRYAKGVRLAFCVLIHSVHTLSAMHYGITGTKTKWLEKWTFTRTFYGSSCSVGAAIHSRLNMRQSAWRSCAVSLSKHCNRNT